MYIILAINVKLRNPNLCSKWRKLARLKFYPQLAKQNWILKCSEDSIRVFYIRSCVFKPLTALCFMCGFRAVLQYSLPEKIAALTSCRSLVCNSQPSLNISMPKKVYPRSSSAAFLWFMVLELWGLSFAAPVLPVIRLIQFYLLCMNWVNWF